MLVFRYTVSRSKGKLFIEGYWQLNNALAKPVTVRGFHEQIQQISEPILFMTYDDDIVRTCFLFILYFPLWL